MSRKGMFLNVLRCISSDYFKTLLYDNALLSANWQIYVKLEDTEDYKYAARNMVPN